MTAAYPSPAVADGLFPPALTDPATILWSGDTPIDLSHSEPETSIYAPFAQGIWKGIFNWMPLCFAASCATSGAALLAFASLVQVSPESNCSNLPSGASDRAHLVCLQAEIAEGDTEAVLRGLDWVGSWNQQHPLFNEAQGLLEIWSDMVIHRAQQQRQNNLAGAIALLQHVPQASPRYPEVQSRLQQWQHTLQQQAQEIYGEAQTALQRQDWAGAFQALWRLQSLEQGVSEANLTATLTHRIEAERQAQRQLNDAIQHHSLGRPGGQGQAIAIASTVNPDTFVWQSAQSLMDQWSDELLPIAVQRLEKGDLPGARVLVRQIAHNPNRRDLAQEWLMLAQAQRLAQVSLQESASPLATTVGLYPAILATQSIQPESPWRSQAMAFAQQWQQQGRSRLTPPSSPHRNLVSQTPEILPETLYQPLFQ